MTPEEYQQRIDALMRERDTFRELHRLAVQRLSAHEPPPAEPCHADEEIADYGRGR